eukprot:GHVU01036473.1.p1 GENE.GHVU01036473.1~~GHVU01036473.1.p1  ORF type:complete len:103 (-),score=10.77 GHVU01036473.1:8-316(-)
MYMFHRLSVSIDYLDSDDSSGRSSRLCMVVRDSDWIIIVAKLAAGRRSKPSKLAGGRLQVRACVRECATDGRRDGREKDFSVRRWTMVEWSPVNAPLARGWE